MKNEYKIKINPAIKAASHVSRLPSFINIEEYPLKLIKDTASKKNI